MSSAYGWIRSGWSLILVTGLLVAPERVLAVSLGEPVQVAWLTVKQDVGYRADLSPRRVQVMVNGADSLQGRIAPFVASLTLGDGATFAVDPEIRPGEGLAGWTATNQSSATGQNHADVLFSPAPGARPIAEGEMFSLGHMVLDHVVSLGSAGGTQGISLSLKDSVTGENLANLDGVLVKAVDPLRISYDAGDVYYPGARINVATERHGFSKTGELVAKDDLIGFDAGSLIVEPVANVVDGETGSVIDFGTAVTAFETTVTGSFRNVLLNLESGNCTDSNIHVMYPLPESDQHRVVFSYSTATFGGQVPLRIHLCVYPFPNPNGDGVIVATPIHASTQLYLGGKVSDRRDEGELRPLRYNGSVAEVTTFNPGSNSTQQSFLRVVNAGDTAGKVTIRGVMDDGTRSADLSFQLGAGESRQINGTRLENGGTGYDGALGMNVGGKWRLEVIGRFAHMRVQSLVRNNMSGTMSDLGGVTDVD